MDYQKFKFPEEKAKKASPLSHDLVCAGLVSIIYLQYCSGSGVFVFKLSRTLVNHYKHDYTKRVMNDDEW